MICSPEITIGNYKAGGRNPCLIIAEIGPNHDGSIERAMELIDMAADCGCDGVKFQYHIADEEIADRTSIIPWSGENRYDFVKNVQEFTPQEHTMLKNKIKEKGLIYIVSPFNLKAVDILINIDLDAFKIASGEITNLELIKKCLFTNKPVILSSGMSTIDEIDLAIKAASETGNNKIILLQCASEYPTRYEDMNLKTIYSFLERYHIPVGLSDHNLDIIPTISSVALGCSMIEKHFTDDKTRSGPDHAVSLEPKEMNMLIEGVRNLEKALGDGDKRLGPNAEKSRQTFNNSIVCAVRIPADTIIEYNHLCLKKPGTGLPPSALEKVVGMKTKRDLNKNTIVKWEDFYEM